MYHFIIYPVFDLALSSDINCIGRKTATIIKAPIKGIIMVRPISEPLTSAMWFGGRVGRGGRVLQTMPIRTTVKKRTIKALLFMFDSEK